MRVHAPAKLNLCLFLGPRRDDGLHQLCSLFEPLALADTIEVAESEKDEVLCPGVEGENLAARALAALRERGWRGPPLRIEIEKRVPVAAGLGGGSADSAAVLRLARGSTEGFPSGIPDLETIASSLSRRAAAACAAARSGKRPTAVGPEPLSIASGAPAARSACNDSPMSGRRDTAAGSRSLTSRSG